MTFKRINQDTICCILTQDDMAEYGVELDDFLTNKGKIQGLLYNIVQKATEVLGFDPQKGFVSMQVMPLPDHGVSITFSENGKLNLMDFLAQMQNVLGQGNIEALTKLMESIQKKSKGQVSAGTVYDNNNEFTPSMITNQQHDKKDKQKQKEVKPSNVRIYQFSSLDDVAKFSAVIFIKQKVVSHLYKECNTYYLIIEKSKLSGPKFDMISRLAMEFGDYVTDRKSRVAYIKEHNKCIIEGEAIKKLRKLVK